VDGWVPVALTWDQFFRAEWEANAGTPFSSPGRLLGLGLGLGTFPDTPNTGTLWIDDLQVLGSQSAQPAQPPAETVPEASATTVSQPASGEQPAEADEPEASGERPAGRLCGGAAFLPLGVLALVVFRRRKR
jgi:hypothetical protein